MCVITTQKSILRCSKEKSVGKKILKNVIISLFLLAIMLPARSQGIKGEIRDLNGEPVPYAAIFIKELTRGTTCNALGMFSLPLPEGSYTIYFRSLGYTEVERTLDVGTEYTELTKNSLDEKCYATPAFADGRIYIRGVENLYCIGDKN